MSLSKFNKGGIKWNVEIPDDCGFTKLETLEGKKGTVRGFFFVNGKYGKQPVMIASITGKPDDVMLIDLPKHMLETVSEICADRDSIESINNLECDFHVEKYYTKKYNKEAFKPVFD